MFELCLCGVGGKLSIHPDYMETRLTRSQILEWQAFYRIRPFGSKRDDMRAAVQTYWTLSGLLEKPPEDHTPEKYQMKFGDGPPLNEAESILQRIRKRLSGAEE